MNETDQQLIELVEQKTPDELTLEEIQQLRERLTDSAALRETLYHQLKMEQYLSHALGRVEVSVDSIFKKAKQQQGRTKQFAWLGVGACVLLAIVVWSFSGGDDESGEEVAQGTADKTDDEKGKELPKKSAWKTNPLTGGKIEKLPPDGVGKKKPDEELPKPDPKDPKVAPPAVGPWSEPDQLGGPPIDINTWAAEAATPPPSTLLRKWLKRVDGYKWTIVRSVPLTADSDGRNRSARGAMAR